MITLGYIYPVLQEAANTILLDYRFHRSIEMRWSDVDALGHINNAVYLTYLEQARVYYFQETCQWDWGVDEVILANVNIDYLRPLLYPSPAIIYVRTSRLGSKSLRLDYLIVNQYPDRQELMAKAQTTLVMYSYDTQSSIPIPDRLRQLLIDYEPALTT